MTDKGRRNQVVIPAKAGIQSSKVDIKGTYLFILQLARSCVDFTRIDMSILVRSGCVCTGRVCVVGKL